MPAGFVGTCDPTALAGTGGESILPLWLHEHRTGSVLTQNSKKW